MGIARCVNTTSNHINTAYQCMGRLSGFDKTQRMFSKLTIAANDTGIMKTIQSLALAVLSPLAFALSLVSRALFTLTCCCRTIEKESSEAVNKVGTAAKDLVNDVKKDAEEIEAEAQALVNGTAERESALKEQESKHQAENGTVEVGEYGVELPTSVIEEEVQPSETGLKTPARVLTPVHEAKTETTEQSVEQLPAPTDDTTAETGSKTPARVLTPAPEAKTETTEETPEQVPATTPETTAKTAEPTVDEVLASVNLQSDETDSVGSLHEEVTLNLGGAKQTVVEEEHEVKTETVTNADGSKLTIKEEILKITKTETTEPAVEAEKTVDPEEKKIA